MAEITAKEIDLRVLSSVDSAFVVAKLNLEQSLKKASDLLGSDNLTQGARTYFENEQTLCIEALARFNRLHRDISSQYWREHWEHARSQPKDVYVTEEPSGTGKTTNSKLNNAQKT